MPRVPAADAGHGVQGLKGGTRVWGLTMDTEALKADIRRRLTLMRYPRRSEARFTDGNDHNPLVLQDCPACHGSGAQSEYWAEGGVQGHARVVCSACGGSGATGEVEPYFPTDAPEASAPEDGEGWLTCPGCGWRFTVRDRNAWTGRRHLRCGQKIRAFTAGAGHES